MDATALLDTFITIQTLLSRSVKITATDKVLFSVHQGIATPREILERLNLSKGNLTNYCKALCAKGSMTRLQNAEGRGICYKLTEKGIDKVNRLLTVIKNASKDFKLNETL